MTDTYDRPGEDYVIAHEGRDSDIGCPLHQHLCGHVAPMSRMEAIGMPAFGTRPAAPATGMACPQCGQEPAAAGVAAALAQTRPGRPGRGVSVLAVPAASERPVDALVAAVDALPLPAEATDRRWTLRTATAGWLRSRRTDATRRAYFRDLADYLAWCAGTDLDPREARRGDVDAYTAARCADLSASSRARRLSTLSSWYAYLISNDVAERNPVLAVDRPSVDRDASPTVGMTGAQVGGFMRTARARTGPTARRDTALLGMLAELALRVGEALRLDLADLRHNRGHRTVRVRGKGNRIREVPVPAPLGRDLDAYLAHRAGAAGVGVDELRGPLFVTATGRRVDQPTVFRLVRRVAAAAGLPNAALLSPHSLRHTAATAALDAGSELRDVQDFLGHADPRTTRRYDRDRGSLDRSPAYRIAALFAHDGRHQDHAADVDEHQDHEHQDHEHHAAGDVDEHDRAAVDEHTEDARGGYAIAFSTVDGWELYAGDDVLAGHDGIDADDHAAAQTWAAEQIHAEHGHTVTTWRPRPNRHDPDSTEYATAV